MLSKRAKYGLKALLALARHRGGSPTRISDLAHDEHIPKKFLELILLELKGHGLVDSRKGVGGGYILGKPADLITMGEVVRILDGPLAPIACVSQTAYERCPDCPDEQACGVRFVMKQVRDGIADILDNTAITDVIAAGAAKKRRAAGRRT
jgi:Rrf2 family protein